MADLGTDTLASMREQVFGLLGESSSQGRLTKIDAALNRAYHRIASSGHWPTLERVDEVGLVKPSDSTRTTLRSGEANFPLPWGCRDITSMVLHEPRGHEVVQMDPAAFFRRYGTTETGVPCHYCLVGETIQHTRLSATDTVIITGAAANESAATLRVYYRVNDDETGEVTSELFDVGSAFSSGVTTAGSLAPGFPLERIVVNDKWVGDITITRTTGGTQLAKLSGPFLAIAGNPMRQVKTRPLARVGPIPDADTKATVVWRRQPQRLLNASDAPEIPVSSALVYSAAAELLRVDSKFAQARDFEAKSEQALSGSEAGESRDPEVSMPVGGSFIDMTGTDEL